MSPQYAADEQGAKRQPARKKRMNTAGQPSFRLFQRISRKQEEVSRSLDWQTDGYQPGTVEMQSLGEIPKGDSQSYRVFTSEMQGTFSGALDPELQKVIDGREPSLLDHKGGFWAQMPEPDTKTHQPKGGSTGEAIAGNTEEKPEHAEEAENPLRRIARRAVRPVLAVAASAAVVIGMWLILNYVILGVQLVVADGNSRIPESEVVALSGVSPGMSMLLMKDDQVKANIRQNRYLTVSSIEKDIANHKVILHVHERDHEAYFRYCGITYVMDRRGMILEDSIDVRTVPNMMKIEGLEDVQDCRVGNRLSLRNPSQMEALMDLLLQLRVMSLQDSVSEIYIKDISNMSLLLKNGYSVRIGDAERIHAKLRAMTLAMDELQKENKQGGTIDVTKPEQPTWLPDYTEA
ncbi:MAG: cell division protein FtsQ/DivIB [Clostridia bacterium]|nr:cell division protein FtsQ/DivIB [Clostridia bacterium]